MKRCVRISPGACEWARHCHHSHVSIDEATGYITPSNFSEHCHFYKRLEEQPEDLVEKLARMAGAHG